MPILNKAEKKLIEEKRDRGEELTSEEISDYGETLDWEEDFGIPKYREVIDENGYIVREYINQGYNMTRKDYIKIADILANQNATKSMIEEFMSMFKCDNYRFDKERFQDYIAKKQNIQRGIKYGNVNLYT